MKFIEADTVILASGSKADRTLLHEVDGITPEIYLIDDCLYSINIGSAIHQGALVLYILDDWKYR